MKSKVDVIAISIPIGILAIFAFLPVVLQQNFLFGTIISVLVFAVMASSWDLTFGVAGLVNLGPGLAYGVGSFAFVILAHSNLNPISALLVAALFACGAGILLWIPSIRMTGAYLAIVTLALVILFSDLALVLTGEEGISIGFEYFAPSLLQFYYGSIVLAALGMSALYLIKESRFGLRLQAMKDDEAAAKSVAVNVALYKLFVFLISSFIIGLAGAFYTFYSTSVSYSIFSIDTDFLPVAIAVIGGTGTIFGALVGSILVIFPQHYLVSYGSYSIIVFGATMVVIILFLKGGILTVIYKFQRRGKFPREKM